MEPRYGALHGALEQLASDRRRDLLASARPRRTATPPERHGVRVRQWLTKAAGLRPATPRPTAAPCAPRSA
jgi:hypothetical protein